MFKQSQSRVDTSLTCVHREIKAWMIPRLLLSDLSPIYYKHGPHRFLYTRKLSTTVLRITWQSIFLNGFLGTCRSGLYLGFRKTMTPWDSSGAAETFHEILIRIIRYHVVGFATQKIWE